jgi:hypothetical protein
LIRQLTIKESAMSLPLTWLCFSQKLMTLSLWLVHFMRPRSIFCELTSR